MRIIFVLLMAVVAMCSSIASGIAAPVIDHLTPASVEVGKEVAISGSGFGGAGKGSEVIVGYGDDFFYVLKPLFWSASKITVVVPDLGKSLRPTLQVKTVTGLSNVRILHLIPQLTVENSPVYDHHLKVGEKGEDVFVMKHRPAACGKTGTLFAEARVHVVKRRFSDAQLVTIPEPSCLHCKALTARWYNEPTGFIRYYIEVKNRLIKGVCPNQGKHISERRHDAVTGQI